MRIIAGKLKGRRLMTPSDNRVRPTTDKVKEAVFNIIAPYTEDSIVVDLFAGTGNLGLEAISRGAARVYFVDRDRTSINLVKENVRHCKVEDMSVIIQADFAAALKKIDSHVDIIFLDPPYKAGYMEKCISMVAESGLLSDGGIIVAEHGAAENLPEEISGLRAIKERKYGKIRITIYENQEAL